MFEKAMKFKGTRSMASIPFGKCAHTFKLSKFTNSQLMKITADDSTNQKIVYWGL